MLKPQFEAGELGHRKHKIQNDALRETIIQQCMQHFEQKDFKVLDRCKSPLPGAKKGNIEEFLHIQPLSPP